MIQDHNLFQTIHPLTGYRTARIQTGNHIEDVIILPTQYIQPQPQPQPLATFDLNQPSNFAMVQQPANFQSAQGLPHPSMVTCQQQQYLPMKKVYDRPYIPKEQWNERKRYIKAMQTWNPSDENQGRPFDFTKGKNLKTQVRRYNEPNFKQWQNQGKKSFDKVCYRDHQEKQIINRAENVRPQNKNNFSNKDLVSQFVQSQMKRYQTSAGPIKRYNEPFGKYESKMQTKPWTKKFGFSHKFGKSGFSFFRDIEKEFQSDIGAWSTDFSNRSKITD